ncbi:MAG TPA: VOC family protein [Allosphingosinicella sp.]|nr:VOC family protein [Allosphingosinicella sp.]
MAKVTELAYLKIGVSSLSQWKQFASEILALEVVDDPQRADRAFLRMDYWHHRLVLEENGVDDLMVHGMRVAGPDQFEIMARQLREAGVEVRIGTLDEALERHVLEVMMLKDPNGMDVEIFHGPHVQVEKPFYPGRGMHGGFKTGEAGIGHLMLFGTATNDQLYKFYRLLGMTGSVEYRVQLPHPPHVGELLFMKCNQRQHTLSFGVPAGKKRINHLMFEVENMDDVSLTYQKVQQAGLKVAITPGRHANDQMYSFYFINPSGFMSEIGWGARLAQAQSEYYDPDTYGHQPVEGVTNEAMEVL